MKKLLLVDDDIAIVKQIAFALRSKYDVLEATTTSEALLKVEEHEIDIAVVDLGLPPHENSYKEGRIVIVKLLEESEAKVIVLTGQESKEYAKELLSLGVFDYIYKPIDLRNLLLSLERASFFIDNEEKNAEEVKLSFSTSLEDGLKGSADKAQKELLSKIVKQTGFNINQTSKILGISRENCYYFLKKFNIQRPDD